MPLMKAHTLHIAKKLMQYKRKWIHEGDFAVLIWNHIQIFTNKVKLLRLFKKRSYNNFFFILLNICFVSIKYFICYLYSIYNFFRELEQPYFKLNSTSQPVCNFIQVHYCTITSNFVCYWGISIWSFFFLYQSYSWWDFRRFTSFCHFLKASVNNLLLFVDWKLHARNSLQYFPLCLRISWAMSKCVCTMCQGFTQRAIILGAYFVWNKRENIWYETKVKYIKFSELLRLNRPTPKHLSKVSPIKKNLRTITMIYY